MCEAVTVRRGGWVTQGDGCGERTDKGRQAGSLPYCAAVLRAAVLRAASPQRVLNHPTAASFIRASLCTRLISFMASADLWR
jgi:hypothetical protein